MNDNNKKIAAMTAVLCYLQAEVEAGLFDMAPDRPAPQHHKNFGVSAAASRR